ncbi:MAG: GNAT family N-acetyltransferase [Pseudomonadota bacterium]
MTAPQHDIEIFELRAPAVLAQLHRDSFENCWDENAFAGLLDVPGAVCLAAAAAGTPAGFVLARQAADEAEILTICVVPAARRRGIARQLMDCLSQRLTGSEMLYLEVDERNRAARALYRSLGFETAGTRKGYYAKADGSRADALLLRRGVVEQKSVPRQAKP